MSKIFGNHFFRFASTRCFSPGFNGYNNLMFGITNMLSMFTFASIMKSAQSLNSYGNNLNQYNSLNSNSLFTGYNYIPSYNSFTMPSLNTLQQPVVPNYNTLGKQPVTEQKPPQEIKPKTKLDNWFNECVDSVDAEATLEALESGKDTTVYKNDVNPFNICGQEVKDALQNKNPNIGEIYKQKVEGVASAEVDRSDYDHEWKIKFR